MATAAKTKTKTKAPRSEIAAALKKAAAFYLFRNGFSVTFELGVMPWGSRRADVVANKVSGKIVILEVKSSLADFRGDKKWKSYLDYCDKFLFCTTEEVYAKIKDELPPEAGVICLSPETGYAYMARRCPILELTDENRISVLARLAYRNGELSKRTQRARERVFLDGTKHVAPDLGTKPAAKRRKRKGLGKSRRKYAKRAVREASMVGKLQRDLAHLIGTNIL